MSARAGFFDFLTGHHRGFRGIAVIMGLSVLGNLVATILLIVAGNNRWALVALVAAVILGLAAIYWLQRPQDVDYLTERQKPGKYPGLIVLVSKGRVDREPMDQSAADAIRYHAESGQAGARPLQHCWLIATAGPDGSLEFAQKLSEACKELGITPHIEVVHDAFGIQETYDLVRNIYAEAETKTGLQPEQIISDFTGSVKPMSVGMVLACGDRYPLQYMYGGKKPMASVPRQIEFTLAPLA